MSEAPKRRRRPTATSNFGVGRRESHDASDFYARFTPPTLSDDDELADPFDLADPFILGDARRMDALPDASVALVVTSPPYFVGKDYERDIERQEVPASYAEYLDMLTQVFAECVRVLEPGGRIAVNVANLGRKPYRSLSADVIGILQDRLGLLLRGEVIWQKGRGSTGSCAWGTYNSPANPVLRDLTERVVIASKGRFDRAKTRVERADDHRPHVVTTNPDEFMDSTLDVWEIDAESAKRVGHPAPFPVELPQRLIHLYTYEGDLVLDPFMGSGTTLVAAARWHRRYVGYDLDPTYVEIARERVDAAIERRGPPMGPPTAAPRPPAVATTPSPATMDFQARASKEGKAIQDIAERVLGDAGFLPVRRNVRIRGLGLTMNFVGVDGKGREWFFDVSGAFTSVRPGLMRTDTLWKCLGRAHVLANQGIAPVIFLTSNLPLRGSEGDRTLRKATHKAFYDAIELFSDDGITRLKAYAKGGFIDDDRLELPLPGFWDEKDLL